MLATAKHGAAWVNAAMIAAKLRERQFALYCTLSGLISYFTVPIADAAVYVKLATGCCGI